MDFRENEKKKKKNEKGNFFEGCLVERGEKKMLVGPPKIFLSKMERKLGGGKSYR